MVLRERPYKIIWWTAVGFAVGGAMSLSHVFQIICGAIGLAVVLFLGLVVEKDYSKEE